jgi:hypothetical protein
MEKPDKQIVKFIKKHHVLTVATADQENPWCFHCFYAYLEDENCFVFTSGEETKHIADVRKNNKVAGGIVLETSIVGKIQGLQLRGIMELPDSEMATKVKIAYYLRFPFAAAMNTTLWLLKAEYYKYTDNRLGFGKKLIWEKTN